MGQRIDVGAQAVYRCGMPEALTTIDCDYMGPGFAAAYLRIERGEAAFIECNTAHAVPRLLAALERQGLSTEAVRYVIVTHVHLDHAGGASALMKACPRATLLAHPRAARHLIDPSKLVASATAVYGADRFRELYGAIDPIEPARARALDDETEVELGGATLRFLHTRGHANHHFVVHDPAQDTVFTGDTFGLVYPALQDRGVFAFPSTSPTDFDPGEARRSIDRVLALGTSSACLTHFGEQRELPAIAAQLRRWIDVSEAAMAEADRGDAHVRTLLEQEMRRAADEIQLTMTAERWAMLDLDLQLNAQGIVIAATRASDPKRSPA